MGVPASLVPIAWAKQLYTDVQKDLFFQRFVGEDANSIIMKQTDLSKQKGDTIRFGLQVKLSADGITSGPLEGTEEEMEMQDMEVKVGILRKAVKFGGELAEQKSPYDLRKQAKGALQTWMAEKIDYRIFLALSGSYAGATFTSNASANRKVYAGTATADNEITDSMKCIPALISKAKRLAKMANPKIRPVKIDGQDHYAFIAHPWQIRDFKEDPKWEEVSKHAAERGKNNPFFTGAAGVWDNVVIFEHENVIVAPNGASGANVAYGLFLGAQAGVWAVAKEPDWREKKFDYDDEVRYATRIIDGIAKSKFNNEDYGVIQIITGAKAD